ncbi:MULTISPECIES: sensor histidine kinase [Bacillus]|uniref:sensor histidine kinase n=1 Tax=Bacillus TaxID=1386 RepID=UPI000BEB433C|nr:MULTISPECIES: sensor histidine kinase [Bacillus]PED47349.1 hypothetical protein CON49_23900 [Bacillus cereus]PFI69575.1 hypothetical protein COI82_16275 [Bacillus cereus]PFO51512.1 hypothetical protein COJ74_27065 [Bacillus cereus]PFP74950.1 hypothetical protein COJ99_00595 [Bacillus cereus]PFQ17279.1 hypothetical protein COK13_26355 [Bacillus cereus]
MATFRTRARAVDLLGKQQIRDEVTAISELLRNSYDADASEGIIDINSKTDRIIVWDDGHGMNLKDLEEHWLTLGTHSKNTKKIIRTSKGRVKIGEKGIGRLAISILGNQLLIISKKESEWALLFLHWELFRNEHMYLENINVPIRSFENCTQLIEFLQHDFIQLKNELLSNFSDTDIWANEDISTISHDINTFNINTEILHYINMIEKRGSGTLFHITNMDDTWDWNLYESTIPDQISIRKKRRLEDQLYSFQNVLETFQNQLNTTSSRPIEDSSFTPKIIINKWDLRNEEWFNEEDMSLYDYSINGAITNGGFSGELSIKYSQNHVEKFYEDSVNLTEGIEKPENRDCGPININLFFVEGKQINSSLTKEQHKNMSAKLEQIGGVFVFRDGLRILPYGEIGNDFLEMEKRRTERAGTFLFSYRRIFGYIEISKESNPHLVDKSSREGFVENRYFQYFREVLINLLKWWAIEFLETSKKNNGRRESRLKQLAEEQQRIEKQKEEVHKEQLYVRELQKQIQGFENNIFNLKNNVKLQLDTILDEANKLTLHPELSNSLINQRIKKLKLAANQVIEQFNSLLIEKQSRYYLDIETSSIIYELNEELLKEKNALTQYFHSKLSQTEKKIHNLIRQNLNDFKSNPNLEKIQSLGKQIDYLISEYKNSLPNQITANENYFIDNINASISNLLLNIEKDYKSITSNAFKEVHHLYDAAYLELEQLINIRNKLDTLDVYYYTEELSLEITKQLSVFEEKLSSIYKQMDTTLSSIEQSNELNWIKNYTSFMEESYNNKIDLDSDDKLIGLLKKEITMYRDISAVGLAAELTSHEFNALYHSIKENLKLLNTALKNTRIIPVVQKVQTAFSSLERMHRRMSPLYRQSRMVRKEIPLKKFIENTIEYFHSDITRYKIKTIIDIPEDLIIKEAEPILFTPIVNILSNAIYWLINQSIKEIHFYVDSSTKCLYIHDTGPGVHSNDSSLVFEPYYTKKINGRGLGLFLSRDLLESKGHKLLLIPNKDRIRDIPGACLCINFKDDSYRFKGELE